MAGNHNQADNERYTANKMLNFGKRGKSEYPGENPLGAEQGTNKFNQNVVSNTE